MVDVSRGNDFRESFKQFGGLVLVPGLFQFSNPLQLLNNQLCQDSTISFFRKGEYGTIKNSRCQLLKMTRSRYSVILIKS